MSTPAMIGAGIAGAATDGATIVTVVTGRLVAAPLAGVAVAGNPEDVLFPVVLGTAPIEALVVGVTGERSEAVGAMVGASANAVVVAVDGVVVFVVAAEGASETALFDVAAIGVLVLGFVAFAAVLLLTFTRRAPWAWLDVASSPAAMNTEQTKTASGFPVRGVRDAVLILGFSSLSQTNRERLGVALLRSQFSVTQP
jgi:hypothetical protein